jgi:cellulose synthase/poly-beta-1,6-N-acetylglucosamine synthase-like glycosyltransferase
MTLDVNAREPMPPILSAAGLDLSNSVAVSPVKQHRPRSARHLLSWSWRTHFIILASAWCVYFALTAFGDGQRVETIQTREWIILAVFHLPYLLILVYLCFGLLERFGYLISARRPQLPGLLPATLPSVCIQLPMFNEDAVARRAIEAAAALKWPRERLEIQVLDDSTDPQIRQSVRGICAEIEARTGVRCTWLHRTDRSGYKAGALEAGRLKSDAEFIAIFDADFVPAPDYLEQIIPHFFASDGTSISDLAMVQAQWGHLNDDDSYLTRAQALWVDDHHTLQQSWRSANVGFVNFTGTAGVWRASAITAIGGWRSASLVEDCELSMRALFHGYRTKFVKEVVAPAELPETLSAYRSQQKRWTQGWVQLQRLHLATLLLRHPCRWFTRIYLAYFTSISCQWLLWTLWVTVFPFMIANGYWLGAFGLWSGLAVYLIPPLAFALFSSLLAAVETRQTYADRPGGYRASRVRRFLRVVPFMVVNAGMLPHHFCAFLEGLFGPMHAEFERTPKTAATSTQSGLPTASTAPPKPKPAAKVAVRPPYLAVELFLVATQTAWVLFFLARGHVIAAVWASWLVGCVSLVALVPLARAWLRAALPHHPVVESQS